MKLDVYITYNTFNVASSDESEKSMSLLISLFECCHRVSS